MDSATGRDTFASEDLRELLARHIVSRTVGCASGSEPETDGELCLYERPRNVYFIGSLVPVPPDRRELDRLTDDLLSEHHSKLAPYACGAEVAIGSDEDARIELVVETSLYYRIAPAYEWQEQLRGADRLVTAFRRRQVRSEPITVEVADLLGKGEFELPSPSPLSDALDDARRLALDDPDMVRTWDDVKVIPGDRASFDAAVRRSLSGEDVPPAWNAAVRLRASPWVEGERTVSVLLVNTALDEGNGANPRDDLCLFDVRLNLRVRGARLRPFNFVELPKSYRFDRSMWGLGLNCTTERSADGDGVKTVNAPVFRQSRTVRRTSVDGTPLPELRYDVLRDDPLPPLRRLAECMDLYEAQWRKNVDDYLPTARSPESREQDRRECRRGADDFAGEIARFRQGIATLENKAQVLAAFQLMNATFAEYGKHPDWHPFQAAFIVSQLPALFGMAHGDAMASEQVSVLWFPTGGGKTEAYLGLTVLQAFYDRMRGKTSGVSALFRFPLRLLTLQQFQRVAAVFAAAEQVRQRKRLGGDQFSVGFWVGGDNTPNNVDDQQAARFAVDERYRNSYAKIKDCPFCGAEESVTVEWEPRSRRLVHKCGKPGCPTERFPGGLLPVYIVDYEIYRYLPTVIVSTIDKLAVAASQVRFGNLFGEVKSRCPDHGFSWEERCDICKQKAPAVPDALRSLLAPSIEVQDELHLIKEDLGAFDAHYEGFVVKYMQSGPGRVPWKTVASTATVRDFERHVEHLYERREPPVRFPVPGPTWLESFYAEQEPGATGRLFVGVLPHNKTHINATVELLWYFHREVQRLRKLPADEFARVVGAGFAVTDEEQHTALDDYEISLTYVLTKRGGDQVAESLGSQVNQYLVRDGGDEVRNETLTGGTPADRITWLMDEVEKRYGAKAPKDRIRSIVATNMISHGVDVNRFNFILFFGMPRQTAEYIQASSRVGRSVPGISLNCFSPARERDRSHYHYFAKYHEYLERLVEPPAINRWSKFSLDKTLRGLLSGLLVNRYSRLLGKSLFFARSVMSVAGALNADEASAWLKDAYRTDAPGGEWFGEEIPHLTRNYLDMLKTSPRRDSTPKNLDAMDSLRDTEEPIPFLVDSSAAHTIQRLRG